MGIASSVDLLARIVAAHRPLNVGQQQAVAALCTMPGYLVEKRLDLWERLVQERWTGEDEESEVDLLLESVFELGRSNLYTMFDPSESRMALREVMNLFKQANIPMPVGLDVRRW